MVLGPAFYNCSSHNSSYANTMAIWGSINCGLASFASFMDARNNGVPAGPALAGFAGNMANGISRNLIAADMQRHGNPMGNIINMTVGYGNPVSNIVGTTALLGCTPWMYFHAMPYVYQPVPMGYYWGGYAWGAPHHHCHHGYWC